MRGVEVDAHGRRIRRREDDQPVDGIGRIRWLEVTAAMWGIAAVVPQCKRGAGR